MSSVYERVKERRRLLAEKAELRKENAELRKQIELAEQDKDIMSKELRKWKGAGAYGRY